MEHLALDDISVHLSSQQHVLYEILPGTVPSFQSLPFSLHNCLPPVRFFGGRILSKMAETYDPMDTDDQVQRRRQRKRHNPYDKSSDFTTRGFKEKQSDFTTKSWRGGSKSDSSSWRGGGYKRTSTSTRPRGYKIEIKNIHWQVSESELKELFRLALLN